MPKSSDKAYARDYKSRVLRPYFHQIHLSDFVDICHSLEQGDPSRLHDLDLITLYDIGAFMNQVEIEQHVSVIHQIWSNLKLKLSQYVGPLQRLEKSLKAQRQVSSTDFWNGLRQERRNRARAAMRDSGELERQFGAYGVVTEEAVRATITVLGLPQDDFSSDDLRQCAIDANLKVADPLEDPDIELDVDTITSCLEKAHRRTLLDAIFDDAFGDGQSQNRFTILDRFQVLDASSEDSKTQLTLSAITQARESARRERQDTGEHREAALGALRASSDHDLHAMVLKHLLDHAVRHAPRVPSRIMAYLESLGLAYDDAQRIAVFIHMHRSLSSRPRADSMENLLRQVRQSILDKDLGEANHLHEHAMSTKAQKGTSETLQRELKAVGEELTDLNQRYMRQRTAGFQAVENRDFAAARVEMLAALAINEDEDLRNTFRALPPSAPNICGVAPCNNSSREADQALRIIWEAGKDTSLDSRYRLIYKHDGKPIGPNDGHVVAAEIRGHDFVDDAPPIAQRFWYAVSTYQEVSEVAMDSQTLVSSPAIYGPIFFCPPVTDLSAVCNGSSIQLTWAAPRRCTAVRIAMSTPGQDLVCDTFTQNSHTFTDLKLLTEYRFQATALFRDKEGNIHESEVISLDVIARSPMHAVTDLDLELHRDRDEPPHIIASFPTQDHYAMRLWSFQQPSPYRVGQQVPIDDLEDMPASSGHELRGHIRSDGDVSVLKAKVGLGISYLQVFTIGSGVACAGCERRLAVAERIDSVSIEQFGDVLNISWPWPASVDQVQVEWQWSGGDLRTDTIMPRHRSSTDQLLQIPIESGSLKLRLRSVYVLSRESSLHSPSLISSHHDSEWLDAIWESRVSEASYCVNRRHIAFGRSRRCTLIYYSQSERVIDTEVIVVASARYEPTMAEGHPVLSRHRLVLSARGDHARVTVTFPRRLKYKWIRAFSVDSASVSLKHMSRSRLCQTSTLHRRRP